MKKYYLLLMLLVGQNIVSQRPELKIYRKVLRPQYVVGMLAGVTGMTISSATVLAALIEKKVRFLAIPGIIGMQGSYALLNSYATWISNRDKPILIFDEEGFTYEKSMGWFKERQYVRYLWKDVISHWSSALVDGWGNELQKTWYYHIDGEEDILAIDVLELDIPKELRARVESLRQGRIRALY